MLNKCEMGFCLKTNLKMKKKILGKIYALGLTKPIWKKKTIETHLSCEDD
jgi:hypothetical protein